MLGRDCLFFSTFSFVRALLSFSFSRSLSFFSFLFLSICRLEGEDEEKAYTFQAFLTHIKKKKKAFQSKGKEVLSTAKSQKIHHHFNISQNQPVQTYWRGAASALLALRDVRRAGCNSPAVRAAMVHLVGAQGEGTGRC